MRTHRNKGMFLKLDVPEKRGRKRRLSDVEDQKQVKRELKKK